MKFVFGWLRNQVVMALGTLLVILAKCPAILHPAPDSSPTLRHDAARCTTAGNYKGWQYYWGDFP